MGKPTICLGENKGADQLRSNCEADQRLCFRYSDSTIPLLLKSEISSFLLASVLVQLGLCRTCSETTLLVFPRGGSLIIQRCVVIRLLVGTMKLVRRLVLTKNTPMILKAKLGIKLKFIMSPFISRLLLGQKSVASYWKMGR